MAADARVGRTRGRRRARPCEDGSRRRGSRTSHAIRIAWVSPGRAAGDRRRRGGAATPADDYVAPPPRLRDCVAPPPRARDAVALLAQCVTARGRLPGAWLRGGAAAAGGGVAASPPGRGRERAGARASRASFTTPATSRMPSAASTRRPRHPACSSRRSRSPPVRRDSPRAARAPASERGPPRAPLGTATPPGGLPPAAATLRDFSRGNSRDH